MAPLDNQSKDDLPGLPDHLKRWPGLYVRDGDRIVEASASEIAVARTYPQFQDKGPIVDGRRITILTEGTVRRVAHAIRVIHVVEFLEPGSQVYVMGPKPICGEYINDELVTDPVPSGDPLVPVDYSGTTLPSPAVDYNYDITAYRLDQVMQYRIQWRLGELYSNVLAIEVVP